MESDSGTTVVCWEISCTTVDDEEHDDKEEEEEEDDDCWLEDLLLFLKTVSVLFVEHQKKLN